jgi:hypothetical protein
MPATSRATVIPQQESEMDSTKQTARLAGLAYLLNGVGSAFLIRPEPQPSVA